MAKISDPLLRRVLGVYRLVHPSMYQSMRWRISRENAETIMRECGDPCEPGIDFAKATMLGMPVDLVDGDEILLVLVA